MEFNLDKTDEKSVLMPALVKLYDSQKLIGLAQDKQPEARSELTSIISGLLEMSLSAKESELVADVLISLMRQVERDLCMAISERLSVMDTVPLRLALHMANDEIDIAGPILKNSKIFSDMDLIYIIKSKTAEYWQAIAKRENMSAEVMETLVDTGDYDTAIALIENEKIELSDHTINVLVDLAQGSDEVAGPLLRRDEITEDIVKTLYKTVGMALKYQIRGDFELFQDDVDGIFDDIMNEFTDAVTYPHANPQCETLEGLKTRSHMKVAERYKQKGLLTMALMLKTLKRGQYQSFVAQFSTYANLPFEVTHEIMRQNSGQGLAVACKATDVERSNFISMYLLGTRLRNQGGMVDVKDLKRATKYFDNIKRDVAIEILERSTGSDSSFIH